MKWNRYSNEIESGWDRQAAGQEKYYIKLDDTRRHATKKIEFRITKQKGNLNLQSTKIYLDRKDKCTEINHLRLCKIFKLKNF